MIVCHCHAITDHDIRAAVDWMRAADPQALITPGKVYRALGKRADCGGCMPLFLAKMAECDSFIIPTEPRRTRPAAGKDFSHEGRQESHRVSQRRAPV